MDESDGEAGGVVYGSNRLSDDELRLLPEAELDAALRKQVRSDDVFVAAAAAEPLGERSEESLNDEVAARRAELFAQPTELNPVRALGEAMGRTAFAEKRTYNVSAGASPWRGRLAWLLGSLGRAPVTDSKETRREDGRK